MRLLSSLGHICMRLAYREASELLDYGYYTTHLHFLLKSFISNNCILNIFSGKKFKFTELSFLYMHKAS